MKRPKLRINKKKIHELDNEEQNKEPLKETNNDNPFDNDNEDSSFEESISDNVFENENTDVNTDNPFNNVSDNAFNPFEETITNNEVDSALDFTDDNSENYTAPTPPLPITKPSIDAELVIDPDMPYFFVFGNSTAGKSAMLSGLIYHLKTSGIGQLRSLSSNDKVHHRKGDFILNRMTKLVRKGEFISGTQTLDRTDFVFPTEINLEFEPFGKPNMPFCLLEMAGEDLKEIELKDDGMSGGDFDERINAYLQHPECNLIFICVVDVDTPEDSEDLIDQFLNFVHKKGHTNNPVLLTVNKWDKVSNQYSNAKDYIEKELPVLKNHLFDENRNVAYMDFSIGKVTTIEDKDIYNYNSKDSHRLLKWMYEIATGNSLDQEFKKSSLSNFFNSFKNIFSNE